MANKHLNAGETVVFTTRTHAKVLLVPALILIALAAASGYLLSLPDDDKGTWAAIILGIAGVLALIFSVWPFLNWLAATYTVTNRRLTTHQGVITRTGHDIQLARISDVSYEKNLIDRILGCGTLVISDASDLGVRLPDVPKVADRQRVIADLLYQVSPNDDGT